MVELAGWKTDAGLIFGGCIGPIEPKKGEWICDERKNKENSAMVDINNECPIIDSKNVEQEIIRLEKRVKALKGLGSDYTKLDGEFDGEIADWMEGITLVRDTFFPEHTKAVAANNLGSLNLNVWPLSFINWEDAAEALKKSYEAIDYDGIKYWIKKPT